MLGTSGSSGERSEPVTASARDLPPFTSGIAGGPSEIVNRHCSLTTQRFDSLVPLNGIATPGMPVLSFNRFAGDGEGRRRGAVIRLVGIGLGPSHQFLHVFDRMIRRHHQHQRERRDHVERDETLGRMIGKIGIDRGGDRHLPGGGDQHRVAVGRLMRDVFGGNPPAGARLVLDDGRGAGVLLELVHHQAREDVVAAAGGKADDKADDAVGIGALRARLAGGGQNQRRRTGKPKSCESAL